MQTELDAINSARTQYRAAFKAMAFGGRWHVYRGSVGVILLMGADTTATLSILVSDVQGMTEEAMVNALSVNWRKGANRGN